MPTKPTRRPGAAPDPAEAANQRVLAEREARILSKLPEPVDLQLGLEEKTPENAAEFLSDEWDRKAFGDPVATIKKTVYGPDTLVDQCPGMKERLEKFGLLDYANATRQAILTKGAAAVPDEVMRRGLRAAIARFGKEAVANAFYERIMKIPVREVEIDASDAVDPLILGGNVLRDVVERYKRPGFAYRFFSERCMGVLGMRGYQLVKDKGEPVKAGTLLLGEIPQEVADARREHWARLSNQEVQEIEEAYREALAREIPNARQHGVSALTNEEVSAGATESEDYLGQTRRSGVLVERRDASLEL